MINFDKMTDKFAYIDSDVEDLIKYMAISQSLASGQNIINREFKAKASKLEFLEWLENMTSHQHIQFNLYAGISINRNSSTNGMLTCKNSK